MEELEQELRAHGQQWEALHEASIREAAAVNQLTARKDQLEEELAEQRETVRHLEGLLQEVCCHAHMPRPCLLSGDVSIGGCQS